MSAPREMTKAEDAVNYVLWRLTQDGRLAYLLGSGTEAFHRLTDAQAERLGLDSTEYRAEIWGRCQPERVVVAEGR